MEEAQAQLAAIALLQTVDSKRADRLLAAIDSVKHATAADVLWAIAHALSCRIHEATDPEIRAAIRHVFNVLVDTQLEQWADEAGALETLEAQGNA